MTKEKEKTRIESLDNDSHLLIESVPANNHDKRSFESLPSKFKSTLFLKKSFSLLKLKRLIHDEPTFETKINNLDNYFRLHDEKSNRFSHP